MRMSLRDDRPSRFPHSRSTQEWLLQLNAIHTLRTIALEKPPAVDAKRPEEYEQERCSQEAELSANRRLK